MKISLLIIFVSTIFLCLINYICKSQNFLLDHKRLKHKSYTSQELVPMTGGFLILFYSFLVFDNLIIKFILFLFFFFGVLSDLFVITNPLKKFFFQVLIIIIFLIFLKINISSTKVFFIDYLLKNKFFSILFTCFCLLILINGSNFMDGVNTLVCGYYALVVLTILYLGSFATIQYNFHNFYYLLLVLIVLFFFNSKSKTYLGDSGVFLLSLIIGYYLIDLSNHNLKSEKYISPIFIMLLLWYPAFESLFSILRKKYSKINPLLPDSMHLHHLLFSFLKKRLNNNINFINTLSGMLINLYNFIIFFIGSQLYSSTKYLSFLVAINIFVYLSFYSFLRRVNIKG